MLHNIKLGRKSKNTGFTLIEIMISVIIYAIISVISYRIITTLVNTKQIAGSAQEKWGNLSTISSNLGSSWNRAIPLVVRDGGGTILPAVLGKNKLSGSFDSQLEITLSGLIGDDVFGTTPPKRVGYRFYQGSLYLVTWPTLNRVPSTTPEVDLLIDNVQSFNVNFLYTDRQWRDTWPPDNGDVTALPQAIKVNFQLNSGESVERVWAL